MDEQTQTVTLNISRLRSSLEKSFCRVGLGYDEAELIVDALIDAEMSDVPTHGVFRVPGYLDGLRSGRYNVEANIQVVHDTELSALIDGDNALGYRPTMIAMEEAIRRARRSLIAVAGVRSTNEFGRAAYYARHAAKAGFIGIVCQNTLAMLGSPGSTFPTHGNNPLAFVTPGADALVFDAAWTPRSGGEIARRRMLGLPIPHEWGYIDSDGNITTDPLNLSAVLSPVGGAKGFGIAAMVDLLAGALTGSSANVSVPRDNSEVGVFALVLSPDIFGHAIEFQSSQGNAARAVREAGGRWPGDRSQTFRQLRHEAGEVAVARPIYDAMANAIHRIAPDISVQ